MRIFQTKKKIVIFFVVGFLLGIIYVHFASGCATVDSRIFSDYFLKQFSSINVDVKDYVPYLIRLRIIPFIIVTVLSFTRIRKVSAVTFLVWTGFSLGMLLTIASYGMGIRGVVMCLITLLPHIFFYVPAYIVVLWYSFSYPRNIWNYQKTLFVLFMMGIGIVLESCMSLALLKDFLKV